MTHTILLHPPSNIYKTQEDVVNSQFYLELQLVYNGYFESELLACARSCKVM